MWAITYNYRKSNPNLQSQARCQHFNCSWGSAVTPWRRRRKGESSSAGSKRNILHRKTTLVRHDSSLEGCQALGCAKILYLIFHCRQYSHTPGHLTAIQTQIYLSQSKICILGECFWKIFRDTGIKYINYALPLFLPYKNKKDPSFPQHYQVPARWYQGFLL